MKTSIVLLENFAWKLKLEVRAQFYALMFNKYCLICFLPLILNDHPGKACRRRKLSAEVSLKQHQGQTVHLLFRHFGLKCMAETCVVINITTHILICQHREQKHHWPLYDKLMIKEAPTDEVPASIRSTTPGRRPAGANKRNVSDHHFMMKTATSVSSFSQLCVFWKTSQ